ncbi:MAG: DNA repair protein RadA, partial [Dehalococcoidia bacterium]|nr:DNA repair protein RadA [Dehalococcoidia bacterium]
MARATRGYRCSACGWETPGYSGQCRQCEAWNTLEQHLAPQKAAPSLRGR